MSDTPRLCNDCGASNDWYMVSHELWNEIGMKGGSNKDQFLCFSCLQNRVGRPLRIEDFPTTHPSGDDMPVNRAVHFGYELALTTITERDHRIAELERGNSTLRGDRDLIHFARDRAEKRLDTATRELAETKAEITRLRVPIMQWCRSYFDGKESSHIALIRIEALIKGGDAPCPITSQPTSSGSNAAHDTSEPSVERQDQQREEDILYGHLRSAARLCVSTIATQRTVMASLRTSIASATTERDQLKSENEKLLATVAAKDAFLRVINHCDCNASESAKGQQHAHWCNTVRIPPMLTPEIANEFVRREVLDDLVKAVVTIQHLVSYGTPPHVTLCAALSRAETELKGKQP